MWGWKGCVGVEGVCGGGRGVWGRRGCVGMEGSIVTTISAECSSGRLGGIMGIVE